MSGENCPVESGTGEGSVKTKDFDSYKYREIISNTASNLVSFAEGFNTIASGEASHAEGKYTTASGDSSHAEGDGTTASGSASHAEGGITTASGEGSHAEGYYTTASGSYQHVQGQYNIQDTTYPAWVSGNHYNVGDKVIDSDYLVGYICLAENSDTVFDSTRKWMRLNHISDNAFIIGNGLDLDHRSNALTVDWDGNGWYAGKVSVGTADNVPTPTADNDLATKKYVDEKASSGGSGSCPVESGTEVGSVKTKDFELYGETISNTASNIASHAEGLRTIASGYASHAEDNETTASGDYSHAEGNTTTASGEASHAEGYDTNASSFYSHAEGSYTTASGDNSHAEGGAGTTASGFYSHAEGLKTTASGGYSHVEGLQTIALGDVSHVFGRFNIADSYSYNNWPEWVSSTEYAVGDKVKRTVTSDDGEIINGYICIKANSDKYFDDRRWFYYGNQMNYVEIVGNGTSEGTRSNAYTLDWSGNGWYAGNLTVNGGSITLHDETGDVTITAAQLRSLLASL